MKYTSCQRVFTSLCKVWWILWMPASVVKWEFSCKSISNNKETNQTSAQLQRLVTSSHH